MEPDTDSSRTTSGDAGNSPQPAEAAQNSTVDHQSHESQAFNTVSPVMGVINSPERCSDSAKSSPTTSVHLSPVEAFNLLRAQITTTETTTVYQLNEESESSIQSSNIVPSGPEEVMVSTGQTNASPPTEMTPPPREQDVDESEVTVEDQTEINPIAETPLNRVDWIRSAPKLIACAEKDYQLSSAGDSSDNYLRGCLWSPDGSCILTNSRDNVLRLFNLPGCLFNAESTDTNPVPEQMSAVLTMRENELVYDYTWYPAMCSSDPATCCFASTVRRNPIRLWDAFSGAVRASYRPINHLGELISAYSIAFSADGQRLYAGFNRFMHVFDVGRPGRDSMRRPRLGKKPTQGGIISCIAVPKHSGRQIYAAGSYNGSVVVYSEPGHPIAQLHTGSAGVTQVQFSGRLGHESGSPWYLIAGSRMDSRIFLWDARKTKTPLLVVHRRVENHQRFQFDCDPTGQFLFTGSQTGAVCVYNLSECLENYHACQLVKPSLLWRAHADCAHGLSVNPTLPLVATSSGQRRIRPPALLFRRKTKRAKTASVAESAEPSGSSALSTDDDNEDVSSNSSVAETGLTDDEASMLPPAGLDDACTAQVSSGARSLPLWGQLTRLPSENRLCLWSFPIMSSDTANSVS